MNAGVISTIWAINPLFNAIADYLIYRQKLTKHHMLGMLGMIICLLCISLAKVVSDDGKPANVTVVDNGEQSLPAYVPVIMALITPIWFTASAMLIKHMTQKRGFDSNRLSYGAFMLVSFIMVVVGIFYWTLIEFDLPVFLVGFFGSIINNVGIVIVNLAFSTGPAGPVAALTCTNTIALTIILAIMS